MQLKKAACTRHSQTFLQLQAPGMVSGRAGPSPAPSPGRGSAGEPLADGGEAGLIARSPQGSEMGFPRSCLCSEMSRFLYAHWTGCSEGRKSLRKLKGKWSAAPLQRGAHLCLMPCLHSPCSVCLRWSSLTTSVSLFHFGLVGKEQGSAPTVRLLRPWEPCM